jgi:microcystin-dependent protein
VPCGCAGDTCTCFFVAGANVEITGSGTRNDPKVISAATTVVDESGSPVGSTDSHFVGEIIDWGGATAPSPDYMPCDHSELNRAAFSALFAVIGTTHGAGDGSTTFNLPDRRDRVPMGSGPTHSRGDTGGSATKVLTAANLPPHAHAIDHDHPVTDVAGDHDHMLSRSDSTGGNHGNLPDGQAATAASSRAAIANDGAHQHEIPPFAGTSGNGTGTSDPVDVLPPFSTTTFYIRVQVTT